VEIFAGPAVSYVKILVHIASLSSLPKQGKDRDHPWWTLKLAH
jgi:hypothetical protein